MKNIGSLRNIQLKRNGRLITTLDLYDLLLHGDTSNDRQLLPGDVIFIPPIGRTVSIEGAVRRPAIYELKSENTVAEAIEIAGGLSARRGRKAGAIGAYSAVAPARDARHRSERRAKPRDGIGERRQAADPGHPSDAREFRGSHRIRVPAGAISNSGRDCGLTDVLGSLDELRPNADQHYIMIRRQNPADERIEVISADLRRRAGGARLRRRILELKPRDKILVFDLSARPRTHPGSGHPGAGTAGHAGTTRAGRQYRRQGQGAGSLSARVDDACQRLDPRRRQPGGCCISRTGRSDPIRRRRMAPGEPS